MSDNNEKPKEPTKVSVNATTPDETNSSLKARLAELEALVSEEKALELEERKLNVELKRHEVARKTQERETRLAQLRAASTQIQAQIAANKALQAQCTHKKGGTVVQGDASVVFNGHGTDSSDYALIKHVLPDGRMFILCSRCLREEWSRNPLTGEPETPGFKEFKNYPTRNATSASSQFVPVQRFDPREVSR